MTEKRKTQYNWPAIAAMAALGTVWYLFILFAEYMWRVYSH